MYVNVCIHDGKCNNQWMLLKIIHGCTIIDGRLTNTLTSSFSLDPIRISVKPYKKYRSMRIKRMELESMADTRFLHNLGIQI